MHTAVLPSSWASRSAACCPAAGRTRAWSRAPGQVTRAAAPSRSASSSSHDAEVRLWLSYFVGDQVQQVAVALLFAAIIRCIMSSAPLRATSAVPSVVPCGAGRALSTRCAIWSGPWLESLPPAQHAARTGCGAGCRKNGVNRRSQSDPPELGASRVPALAPPSQCFTSNAIVAATEERPRGTRGCEKAKIFVCQGLAWVSAA